GTNLLGVKAVLAASYERIHRSNLVMMGVLPLQFVKGENGEDHGLDGFERFDINIEERLTVGVVLGVFRTKENCEQVTFQAKVRFDSEVEADYYRHGGILQLVLRNKIASA